MKEQVWVLSGTTGHGQCVRRLQKACGGKCVKVQNHVLNVKREGQERVRQGDAKLLQTCRCLESYTSNYKQQ